MKEFRDAHFSECGRYRFRLDRRWGPAPYCLFLMLNPSKAGAEDDDPTARKCRGFAQRFGCGGYFAANCYAWIATDPADLKRAHWPTGGALADRVIRRTLDIVGPDGYVICAWGSHARGMSRPAELIAMIRAAGLTPRALAINKDGTPAHPLMLAYGTATEPMVWQP